MPITDLTQYADLDAALQEQIKRIEAALIRTLKWVGEECVNHARNLPAPKINLADYKGKPIPPHKPHYIDWTANLRSSIGYVIAVDGHVVTESKFKPVKGGKEGASQGRDFALSIVSEYPKGIVLIIVAGKDYAVHVTNRGYDVLDSSELEAQKLVPEMLASLKL